MAEPGDAGQSIGRLQGRRKDLPDPGALIQPLHTSEAWIAPREIPTLAKARAQPEKTGMAGDNMQEALNYRVALDEAVNMLPDTPVSCSVFVDIHKRRI